MKAGMPLRSLLGGIFGLALVIGLFISVGLTPKEFIELLLRIKLWPFAGIVVCSFIYVILGAIKWHLIAGVKPPRRFFYTYYPAQAMLIGQFLPPPVAIAVNRAAVMKFKQNATLKKGFLNALYDMGFDFLIALVLVPASLLQLLYHFGFNVWLALGAVLLIATTFGLMQASKILPKSWRAKLEISENKKHELWAPRITGLLMLLSAARLVIVIVRQGLGAVALAVAIPFTVVAYVVPAATMSSLIVLTPANLGIAEWSWTYLLTLWGVPAAIGAFYGVSFRILVFIAQVIVSGLCWLLYEAGNRR
jgi:uncharacterized membrane protein YbhN (UPF0104 family)